MNHVKSHLLRGVCGVRRHFWKISALMLIGLLLLGSWVMWGSWPDPPAVPAPWEPDAVVVLGGGNQGRSREAARLAREYPDVPLIVTGDGGVIYEALLEAGISPSRITHEKRATSTLENARFTGDWLAEVGASRVVLVTNGFHAPRATAIFSREYPGRKFWAVFEPRPAEPSNWYQYCERRERLAALHNLLFHGVWSF